MIQLLLVAVVTTVCKAQYGDVAPPAPVPPLNYGSEETSNTNKASSPENGYENPTEQTTQPQLTVAPDHSVGNVTCRVPVETQELPQQPSIPTSPTTRSSSTPSKLPLLSQRPTTSPSRPQTLSTTKASQQTTRRPIQTTVTTRSRTTASSRRPGSVLTTQRPGTTRPTQTAARITSKQTSAAPRTTRLPTPPVTEATQRDKETTRRPEVRPVSFDCTKAFDTLFVVDSTSSVRHFFDDHLTYIAETIKMILPENDNESRIGLIEYSSPLRRQVKIPFVAHGNRAEIIEMIKKLPFFAGITATGAALKLALEVLQERRSDVVTNVVVLTDGFSYDYVDEAATMLHRLPNVRTFTATVTDSWRQYELETIAGDPKKVFRGKDSVRDLARALTSCDNAVRLRGSRRSNLFK